MKINLLALIPILAVSSFAQTRAKPKSDPAAVLEAQSTTKTVPYTEREVINIRTKLRFTTMIMLPKNEEILDFTCGDKTFWVIEGNQNLAHVKPAKVGARTNLNLVTASGNIYSFLLTEVGEDSQLQPDLKVFVELKDDGMASAASGPARFVPAQTLADYRQQLELAKQETLKVQAAAQTAIEEGKKSFIDHVRFPYRFEAGKKPFYVRAMFTDEKFTYIQARPEETPTLYEIKDGKPSLVDFQYKEGLYVVTKIVDRGYLTVGKRKLKFKKED